jgi:hypothetical protein
VVYSYNGHTFDDLSPNYKLPAGQYDTTMYVQISLTTFCGYLPDGEMYDVRPYLADWSFFDGRGQLDSTTPDAEFSVGTISVSGGDIVAWNLTAQIGSFLSDDYSHDIWIQNILSLPYYFDQGRIAVLISETPQPTWSFEYGSIYVESRDSPPPVDWTIIVHSDCDGIPDAEDLCPEENSTGFDTDYDGCIDSAEDLGITNPGLESALLDKTNNLQDKIEDGKIKTACKLLGSMIKQAYGQRHHFDPPENADALIEYLEILKEQWGCDSL